MHSPKRLSQIEFIALMAMTSGTLAFSIDSMLPALTQIGQELSPSNLNRAQLIITSFVLGMGVGTFFTGPLSDRFGRKPVMLAGAALYIVGCFLAWVAPSLELMLAARVVQGLGSSGPRVVSMAMIRDLYSGRDMARITSFVMIVFSLVPAIAPSLGYVLIQTTGWRSLFISFIVFASIATLWLLIRQTETLAVENRRPLKVSSLMAATREMMVHPTSRLSIFVQCLAFGMLFSVLSSTQQVFDQSYGFGETFHLWFAGIAVVATSASFLNARLVVRLGMRAMIKSMMIAQIILSVVMIAAIWLPLPQPIEFAIYLIWTTSVFFQAGLTIGNLNALALEPMGHIAGLAASVMSAIATIGAVIIAVPVGLAFDGTALPLALGILICAIIAFWLTTKIRRDSD